LARQQPDPLLVLTTIPLDFDADAFSGTLLAEHLAACVSVFPPMVSTYRWQGRVESASERQVVIKTTRPRLEALERRISELHPYELPELLVVAVSGGASYLAWLAGAVGEDIDGVNREP